MFDPKKAVFFMRPRLFEILMFWSLIPKYGFIRPYLFDAEQHQNPPKLAELTAPMEKGWHAYILFPTEICRETDFEAELSDDFARAEIQAGIYDGPDEEFGMISVLESEILKAGGSIHGVIDDPRAPKIEAIMEILGAKKDRLVLYPGQGIEVAGPAAEVFLGQYPSAARSYEFRQLFFTDGQTPKASEFLWKHASCAACLVDTALASGVGDVLHVESRDRMSERVVELTKMIETLGPTWAEKQFLRASPMFEYVLQIVGG